MKKPFSPPIIKDWEQRLSEFLREAGERPHMEPEICEELIEYVQYLISVDRAAYRLNCRNLIIRLFGKSHLFKKFAPRVLNGEAQ